MPWHTSAADERPHDSTQPQNRTVTGKANDKGPRRTVPTPESKPSVAVKSSHHNRHSVAKRPPSSPHEGRHVHRERAAKPLTDHSRKRYPRRHPQDPSGFLNRGLDLRLVPREVKALLVLLVGVTATKNLQLRGCRPSFELAVSPLEYPSALRRSIAKAQGDGRS